MAKFVFAYHGGGMPESPEEGAKVMAAWQAWMAGLGSAIVDGGAPVSASKTVSSSGVEDDGGSNPLTGYSVIEAASYDAAVAHAKGCPILDSGGTVEVAETMEM